MLQIKQSEKNNVDLKVSLVSELICDCDDVCFTAFIYI